MAKEVKMKTIAVLCSGGDSPGMNCAIRAVVRTAIGEGLDVIGIRRGYEGLLQQDFYNMDASSVGNIMQHGGTILQTSRCPDFHQESTRAKAVEILKEKNIDGLVVIGGNGSFQGAYALYKEHQFPVVGIPGTIDNDISGTNYTIGFDTAVQTAIEAVDKIRDTAHSHARNFVVEVMGRKSPAIALHVGVCTGAENIVFPTRGVDYKQIASDINRGVARGKNSSIIIVAEGDKPGLSYDIHKTLKEKYSIESHICILGHIQRGGNPTAIDRFLASKMGYIAAKALISSDYPIVSAFVDGDVIMTPFENCLETKQEYEVPYLEIARALSI